MVIVCKYAINSEVPDSIRFNDDLKTARFDLIVGQTYFVYGQMIFRRKVQYLLDPDDSFKPSWYPAELFSVEDRSVPDYWQFDFFPEQFGDDLGAIWGYEELVRNPEHFN